MKSKHMGLSVLAAAPAEAVFMHSFTACSRGARCGMHLAPPDSRSRGAHSLQVNKYIR